MGSLYSQSFQAGYEGIHRSGATTSASIARHILFRGAERQTVVPGLLCEWCLPTRTNRGTLNASDWAVEFLHTDVACRCRHSVASEYDIIGGDLAPARLGKVPFGQLLGGVLACSFGRAPFSPLPSPPTIRQKNHSSPHSDDAEASSPTTNRGACQPLNSAVMLEHVESPPASMYKNCRSMAPDNGSHGCLRAAPTDARPPRVSSARICPAKPSPCSRGNSAVPAGALSAAVAPSSFGNWRDWFPRLIWRHGGSRRSRSQGISSATNSRAQETMGIGCKQATGCSLGSYPSICDTMASPSISPATTCRISGPVATPIRKKPAGDDTTYQFLPTHGRNFMHTSAQECRCTCKMKGIVISCRQRVPPPTPPHQLECMASGCNPSETWEPQNSISRSIIIGYGDQAADRRTVRKLPCRAHRQNTAERQTQVAARSRQYEGRQKISQESSTLTEQRSAKVCADAPDVSRNDSFLQKPVQAYQEDFMSRMAVTAPATLSTGHQLEGHNLDSPSLQALEQRFSRQFLKQLQDQFHRELHEHTQAKLKSQGQFQLPMDETSLEADKKKKNGNFPEYLTECQTLQHMPAPCRAHLDHKMHEKSQMRHMGQRRIKTACEQRTDRTSSSAWGKSGLERCQSGPLFAPTHQSFRFVSVPLPPLSAACMQRQTWLQSWAGKACFEKDKQLHSTLMELVSRYTSLHSRKHRSCIPAATA